MDSLSRRRFIGWTGAAAAGVGLVSLARHLGSSGDKPATSGASQPAPKVTEPLMAYVENPAAGRISLMAGTQEVVLHDPDLVARLIGRLAGR